MTILQELGQTEDLMATIEKSVSDGDILIMYDDACTFDSRLDVLYRRCFVKSEAEDGNEDVLIEVIQDFVLQYRAHGIKSPNSFFLV